MTEQTKQLNLELEKLARPICLFLANMIEQKKITVAQASTYAREIVKRIRNSEDGGQINRYLIEQLPDFGKYLKSYQGTDQT